LVTSFSQSFLSQDQDQQTEDTQDIARKFSEALCRSSGPSFSKAVLLKQMRPVQNVSHFVFLLLHPLRAAGDDHGYTTRLAYADCDK